MNGTPLPGPGRARFSRVFFAPLLVGLAGCGVEGCLGLGDFQATPEPEATLRGTIGDLPDALSGRLGFTSLRVRALSVDGAELAVTETQPSQTFTLNLGPGLDHFNVRVVVDSGSVLLRGFAAEAAAGAEVDVGTLGVTSTAAALVAERYAVRERAGLASTPVGTLAAVLENAAGDEPAVGAFRSIVSEVLAATDPATGEPAFDPAGYIADTTALGQAGVDAGAYESALEAAVNASLVPVVCDPSRLRVMFTVDTSGQGKDGNGSAQFIRQPSKEGKVFLGITIDPSSPVPDSAAVLKPRLTPNDPSTEMFDDGTQGDEVASDGIFTRILDLPTGMRVLYKYTNGSAGEGFTGTEEWPGNARILEVQDVLTGVASGTPDCLVIRRDVFGDESSNKNFVNLHARLAGGDLSYEQDLGGEVVPPAPGDDLKRPGGLSVDDTRSKGTLTPAGIPEARENGVCQLCPAPLTVSADDDAPPRLLAAAFIATDRARITFSEDIDVQTAGSASNYLLTNTEEGNAPVAVTSVQVVGASVILTHDTLDPRVRHRLSVKGVRDASLRQNEIEPGANIVVGPDRTPPTVVEVRPASIVELNPGSRPGNPETGEVVIVTFSEVLDKIAAENADGYSIDGLEVLAAFQRGRDVLLVTSQQTRSAPYTLFVGTVFDVAGNVVTTPEPVPFRGLSLSQVTFRAVVDFAY
ncbi:MAG: choice-of-anchor X domain-containing protein, partial [Myxococcota bacterium]